MRVKLLSDGGFMGLSGVTFPVEVESKDYKGIGVTVDRSEMQRIGADKVLFGGDVAWPFYQGEYEEI